MCLYNFSIRAGNLLGYGNWSEDRLQLTIGISGAVGNFRAEATYSMQVDLEWTSPSDTGTFQPNTSLIRNYIVETSLNSAFSPLLNRLLAPNNCTGVSVCSVFYSIRNADLIRNSQTSLPLWTLVYFRVYAVTDVGAGNYSETVSVAPAIPSLRDPIVRLQGSNVTGARNSSLRVQFRLFTTLNINDYVAVGGLGPFGIDGAYLSGNIIAGLDGSVFVQRAGDMQGAYLASWNGTVNQITTSDIHQDGNGFVANEGNGILYFKRSGLSMAPSGSTISFEIANITNPHQSGSFSFNLWTLNSYGNFTQDQASNVSGVTIASGPLGNASIQVSDPRVGSLTTIKLSFNLGSRNTFTTSCSIEVLFGSYLNLGNDASSIQVTGLSGIDGNFIVNLSGGRFIIQREGGSNILPGVAISLGIQGTNYVFVSSQSSAIVIRLLSSASSVIDQSTDWIYVNVVPFFLISQIRQSTPVALARNTLSIDISLSVNMTFPCNITVAGLNGYPGLQPASSVNFIPGAGTFMASTILCNSNLMAGSGTWISGALILLLCQGQSLGSSTLLSIAFSVSNPAVDTAPSDIFISSTGNPTIPAIKMTSPTNPLLGISDGYRPLRVIVPAFSIFVAAQSTPIASATNVVTVTLGCKNVECSAGTTLTISGISSSSTKTGPSPSLNLAGPSSALFTGSAGDFDPIGGTFKLTIAPGQAIALGSNISFTFTVENADVDSQAPNLTLSGTGNISVFCLNASQFTSLLNSLVSVSMNGVASWYTPFFLIVPKFSKIVVTQVITGSTPLINTITVTFSSSNIDCMVGTIFTLSGLIGSNMTGTDKIVLSGSDSALFGSTAAFNSAAGSLIFTVLTGASSAGSDVSFSFSLYVGMNWSASSITLSGRVSASAFGKNASSYVPISGPCSCYGVMYYAFPPTARSPTACVIDIRRLVSNFNNFLHSNGSAAIEIDMDGDSTSIRV